MMMRRIKAEMPRDKKSEFLSQETAGISVAPPRRLNIMLPCNCSSSLNFLALMKTRCTARWINPSSHQPGGLRRSFHTPFSPEVTCSASKSCSSSS